MKREYKVQCLFNYNDGTEHWSNWGVAVVFDTYAEAEEEKRRGEYAFHGYKFRIVSREVTEWEECNGANALGIYEVLRECEDKLDAVDPFCTLLQRVRDVLAKAGGAE